MIEALVTFATIGMVAAVAALVVGITLLTRGKWKATMLAVADGLKLQYDPGSFTKSASAYGMHDAFHVKVDSYTVSSGNSQQVYTRIVVGTDLPRSLRFKKEGMFSGFKKMFTGSDVEVGIDVFDEAFLLDGRRELDVLSRMGGRARAAMWQAIGSGGAEVKDGEIVWTTGGRVKDPGKLIATTRALLELAKALSDHPGRNGEALLNHASNDRDARFRRTCLQALIRELPNSEATRTAVERAAHDADAGMRYLAAKTQGTAGHELIRALLRSGDLPEDLRSEAAALLGPGFGGGLALAPEGDAAGRLAIKEEAGRGALSEASEPARRPRGKVKQ